MKIIHKKTETYHYFQDQVQKNDQVAEQTIDLRNKQDFFEAILDDSNYILQKLPTEVSVQSEQDLLSHPEALSHYKLNNQNTLSLCVIGSLQKLYEMDSKNLQMITEKQFNATKSFGDVIRKRGRRCNKTMKLGKRRCTCKKTQCQKKYCDCFRQGLRCGIDCQCLNCLNIKHDHVLEMDGSCERYLSLC